MKSNPRFLAIAAGLLLSMPLHAVDPPGILNHQGRITVNGVNHDGTGYFKFALVNPGTNLSVQATATSTIDAEVVTSVTVTDGGSGYTVAPAVSFSGGGGSGAAAFATISGGAVTSITVTDGGNGYMIDPEVLIEAPPANWNFVSYWSHDGSSSGGSEPTTAVPVAVSKGHYALMMGDTTLTNMTQAVPPSVFTEHADVSLRLWFATNAGGPFELLSPDRRIASTGYAMSAGQASTMAPGAVTGEMLADGAVTSEKIASDAVTTGKISQGAVTSATLAPGAVTSAAVADGSIAARDLALGATGLVRKPILLSEVGGGAGSLVFTPMSLQLDPAGQLDASFGVGGKVNVHSGADDTAYALAFQDDGKIVIAGYSDVGDSGYVVGRLLSDGSPDPSFASTGFATFGATVNVYGGPELEEFRSVAIQEDGSIFAGGWSEESLFALAKLSPNGTLDTSFGTNGMVFPRSGTGYMDQIGDVPGVQGVHTVLLQDDGKIVLVGCSVDMTYPQYDWGPQTFAVVRCNPDGTTNANSIDRIGGAEDLDTSAFATGGVLQQDGKILVAGYSSINGNDDFVLLRYQPNLSIDLGFGTNGWVITDLGGSDYAEEVALAGDGKIVVAGYSDGDIAIVRYLSNGALDTGFGSGGKTILDVGSYCRIYGLKLDDAGRICVAGSQAGNFLLARFTPDGLPDPLFGTGGVVVTDFGGSNDFARGLETDAQGRVVVCGYTDGPDPGGDFALARYYGSPPWNGSSASVCVTDDIAYRIGSVAGVGNLKTVDISNPASPVVLTDQSSPHPLIDLDGARDICVEGDTAYIVSQEYGTLTTLDVSDPSNIQLLGAVGDGLAGFNHLGGAWSVAVSGSTAYVAALGDNALTTINVTNPSAPVMLAELVDGAGGFNRLAGARDVFVDGDTAYVTATNDNALTIIDVSNPASPALLAELVDESGGFTKLAGAREVFVRDGIAYVTADADDALTLIDVSDPSAPVLLAELVDGTGGFNRLDGAAGVFVSGTIAMVTAENDDAVTMIDVSDPSSPVILEEVVDGIDGFNLLDGADGLCIYGSLALVASSQDQALSILDLASATAPYAGTITHDQLADNSVASANIVDGAVEASDIADNAVTSDKIAAGAVGGSALAGGAVTADKIGVAAVGGSALAGGAVTADKIGVAAVGGSALAGGAVTAEKVAAGAIGGIALADEAVSSAKITSGAVTSAKLAGAAVDTAALAAEAVTKEKIAASAVGTTQIEAAAVTKAKIAASAVGTTQIEAAAVTKAKIAASAVGTTQIEAAAVSEEKLAPGSVTLSKLNLGGTSGQILYNTGSATEWRNPVAVLGDESASNEIQTLTLDGPTLSLSPGGGSVSLSGVADNDPDPTNELQDLVLASEVLSISDGSGSVDLGMYFREGATGELNLGGNSIENVNQIVPAGAPPSLSVMGDLQLNGASLKSLGSLSGTNSGDDPVILGSDLNLDIHRIRNVQRLGIGVSDPGEVLHVASNDSGGGNPAVFEHSMLGGISQMHTLASLRANSLSAANDGFGGALQFEVDDTTTSGPIAIGRIGATRGEDPMPMVGGLVFETLSGTLAARMTLEPDGQLRLNGDLSVGRAEYGDNDTIFFDSNEDDTYLRWHNNQNRFIFSHDLSVPTLYQTSDRDLKEGIVPVDPADLLERLDGVPVSTWNFRSDEDTLRHIGPMAQDFHKAFGLGIDERHISTTDADGVAFAAIQALKRLLDEKEQQIEKLEKRIERLEKAMNGGKP